MYELVFRRFGKAFFSVFAVLSVLVGVSSVSAQTTGNLQGIVRDPNGAVVAGAAVKVTNTGTGQVRETTTNEDGLYRVVNLLPGDSYQIEVTAVGFSTKIVENVAIRLATENSGDIELGVQGASGEVTVTGEAPLINSTQNQLSTSYSEKQLTQLPYNGGSIDNLALLTPGVVTPGDTDFSNGVGISANGNRGRSNNFQLDGQDNNDNSVAGPSLSITNAEAIGDYQVTTNNPSAEFGRNAGAQINVITKSGTNEFRGSLFEFIQNNRLNSRTNIEKQYASAYRFLADNGFSQLKGLANRNGQNPFSYNRFGGALGGPIVKNRAFFFATFQADIQNGEQDVNNLGFGGYTFTPDSIRAAQALGLPGATSILGSTNVGGGPAFAKVPGTFYVVPALQDTNGDGVVDAFVNPGGAFTRSAFLCRVPAVEGACPAGNLVPLLTGEAIRVAPNNFRAYQLITKEDFNITSKDTLNVRYIYDNTKFPNTAAAGNLLTGASFDVPSKNNNLGVTYTRLINSTFTNEFRFNFSRLDVKFGDPDGTLPGPGISFTGQRDVAGNFSSLAFGTANNLPQSRLVDVYQQQNTFSASLGNHFVKTGFDIRQQKVNNFFLPNFLGVYRFRNIGTNSSAVNASCPLCQFYAANGNTRNGSTAFENLLLARPERITFALGNPRIETKQNDYFFFVQDDWRVRSNLTLNLGVRYEYSSTPFNPIIEKINEREANASTAIFNTAFPLEFRTAKKLKTDKNNFAPRVGFAYSPDFGFFGDRFRGGKTVIRAGFGIAYDPSFFNIVLNTVTAAPFAAAGSFFATPGIPPAGQTSPITFPFLPSTTAQLNRTPGTTTIINGVAQGGDPRLFNQTRVDPNFYNPYTMQYSVGIQQEVFKDSVLEVRFVGSRIIGQYQTVNGNPNIQILNRQAQCLGLSPGTFTNGNVVGTAAPTAADACTGQGFNNRPGTTGNGRLDPNFGPVRVRNNGATATYSGLQTRFDTRFSDIIFNANYSFSRTIDNASEIFSTFAGGQSVANSQNPFDTRVGERGLSAFHQKHNFTANFIYELPFFKDQKGIAGKLLGGYQFAGIIRLGSGRPYTPVEFLGNIDTLYESGFFSGVGALRPFNGNSTAPVGTIAFGYEAACNQLFGGPECTGAVAGNFIVYNTLKPGSQGVVVANAQAAQQMARLIYNDAGLGALGVDLSTLEAFRYFKTPYGDVGRNTFLGSNFYNVNLSMLKSFKITERMQLELRGEAVNLFNERNFGVPDAFTEDASFGNFVGSFQNPGYNTGSARQLRFGVRFLF
ncbi:MAG: Plug and carboxypeptidase regulatory-like domain-containing protein [Pyrinomonadaceae bacterium]|nr:Plug and carboxypeptidase regulatory-like domain-containing protein [Pyrinomonadaceae bacterium]